ncbi:ubiquitin-conjugating enzyme E2 J1-like [Onthophagus taurus]|uniref:ubiquitin-conjugating enzyme E2 J1-like n=1 Tax=Onthophagus taurus TaxID=166361 RepID=UPI000C205D01|nr:ubiquitin-conjugating enzyme E2 J1-like [Onthophagus taurus]
MDSLQTKYNLKSPGVKRLMREAMELAEATEEYHACPLEDNLFEWHFTVRGPPSTEFDGGLYHGRILLPTQYPMQPPNIILLTPNGRFETNKKICLSISGYHPESWQPSWSIRTALLALIAFMPTPAAGTVGSLDYTAEERKVLAKKSQNWECHICGRIQDKLVTGKSVGRTLLSTEESTLLKQIALKGEEESNRPVKTEKDNNDLELQNGVDGLRQRGSGTLNQPGSLEVVQESLPDVLLQASIQRSNRDRMWSAVVWAIISTITLLIIRRFFFL